MNKSNAILVSEGIHKSYRMGATEVRVLKGVNLAVQKGEFVAIVGASGSGKSTLLHILGALDKPDKGVVRFEKQNLSSFGSGELNKFRNKMVGFVFQFYHLLDELSVLENVYLPAMASKSVLGWLAYRRRAKGRAGGILTRLGLSERAEHKPYQLSGGERQRVAIGRALMATPKLMLLDEPSLGLAPILVEEIFQILIRMNSNEKMTLLLVEQNATMALEIAQYGYIMENGRVVLDGDPQTLGDNEDVREFYLGLTEIGKKSYRDVKHYKRRKRWLA